MVVVDASAAYLQRRGLDNLADGAALHGVDLGSPASTSRDSTGSACCRRRLQSRWPSATTSCGRTPRRPTSPIDVAVRVDAAGRSVTVLLRAPLDLPLRVPGSPASPRVGASSTAAVAVR
ncbi:hypothetical protein [Nocardioides furvisabuli]|uniref:hypothetical protein n=1 Tax=Nocardioides furvisabuli TaxID=375542 RepID=UPI0035572D53